MKILYLVSGIGPPAGWGTEFIQDIIFEIAKDGTDITIINPIYKHTAENWREWTKEQERKFGVRIISMQVPKTFSNNLYFHFAITPVLVTLLTLNLLGKEKFDIVHEFSSTPIVLLRSFLVKIFFNTPTVFTLSVYNNTLLGNFFWFRLFDFAKIYCIPSEEIAKNFCKVDRK